MRVPANLKPAQVTAIIDSRERLPWDLSPMMTVRDRLTTGDYSARGLEHVLRLERKSLSDLLQCVGRDRDRFEREIERLLAFPVRTLVVEASWHTIEAGKYQSQVRPNAVIGSLLGWITSGLPIVMAGDRRRAERYAKRIMLTTAKRRWRELRSMAMAVD